ncbi:MAG: hypothetical protein BECKG1743E_GA0114224_106491, partial [Candidatus Kentron sp. G]
ADVKCLNFLYLYVGRYPRNNASRNTREDHDTRCGSPRYTTIRRFLVFCARFSCNHFIRYWFAIAIDLVRLFR